MRRNNLRGKWFGPNAPHVNWHTVAFLKEDLWCCVTKRSSKVMELFFGSVEMFCTAKGGVIYGNRLGGNLHAKVRDDDVRGVIAGTVEDILGLQVTVDNVVLVQILNAREDTAENAYGICLGELSALYYSLKEFTPSRKFE